MKKISFSILLVFPFTLLFAQQKTENIIIVTLDGFRWQEVFAGADAALINKTYVGDVSSLKEQYWATSPVERRSKLLPF